MNITIAIDSLKGSLTSLEAGQAIKEGILSVDPNAQVHILPMADGGEGTVDALVSGLGGSIRTIQVTGPLGTPTDCRYGIVRSEAGKMAVIEMAEAAGLPLVPLEERNPLHTTTYGVGEVICDAIGQGCRQFLVGIGGSATNDGGIGMLQALGFQFLDGEGLPVPHGARGLKKAVSIDSSQCHPALAQCHFQIACDVTNPLYGPQGASHIFGPQKGATPAMVQQMDLWMSDYAKLVHTYYPLADAQQPGAGAAGGLGFAFQTFTNAILKPGVDIVLEISGLERLIQASDLVITGEGRLDAQTAMGKTPIGVARLAKRYHKPVIAFAGAVTDDAQQLNQFGIDAFFPILRTAAPLSEVMQPETAKGNMTAAARQVFRLIQAAKQIS